jgi:phosphoglycolate phosphatase-like HAD superfamily hydrolase
MRVSQLFLAAAAAATGASRVQRAVTLITFDVDGTLVQGSSAAAQVSAHARSFAHAVGRVFGNVGDWEKTCPSPPLIIPSEWYHGSTDGLIALQLAKCGFNIPANEASKRLGDVFDQMHSFVTNLSDEEVAKGIEVLPGVRQTLMALAHRRSEAGDILVGLVTGNVEGIARKKMKALGLSQLGAFSKASSEQDARNWPGEEDTGFLGGFGSCFCSMDISDHSRLYKDRGEQILIALRRAQSTLGPGERLARVVHVGDAPADVLAAAYCASHPAITDQGIQVGCIGVSTGKFSSDELWNLMGDRGMKGDWVVLEKGVGDLEFIKHCRIVTF